ncbi:MAG: sensor histidine kinase [bacterium]
MSAEPDWPILYASPETGKVTGRSPDKLQGKPFSCLLSGSIDPFMQRIQSVYQEKSSCEGIPCTLTDRVKYAACLEPVTALWKTTPLIVIRLTDKSSFSLLSIKKERDEQHKQLLHAYDELQKAQSRLIQSEKLAATGKLVASIAHEINNPMYGIQGCLKSIIKNKSLSETDRNFTKLAIKETYRISNLIRQLQDFHKPGESEMALCDLHELLENVLLFNKSYLNSQNIKLIKQFSSQPIKLNVIEDQIKQVVTNLISNAVKAMPNSGTLIIQTECEDRFAKICFGDTGHGISERNLPHIFEPFFTTGKKVKGVGLGLSVAYGIIKKHKGKIEVTSLKNQGTTFTILLPV